MKKKYFIYIVLLIILTTYTLGFAQEYIEPKILNYGYGQDQNSLSYGFIIENPNDNILFERVEYLVAAFDENGIVVETDSATISTLLPGETTGISGDMYLDDGITVTNIEIKIKTNRYEEMEKIETFSVNSTSYLDSDYFQYATGVIHNPFEMNITNLRVSAILYDENDQIIGGGYTYQDFILKNSDIGVKISTTSKGVVSRVEIYPILSSLSNNKEFQDEFKSLEITKYGYGQDGNSIGAGFIILNPNENYGIEDSKYQVTCFSNDGIVLDTDSGYINVIYPNQIIGIASELYLSETSNVDYIDVQVLNGDYVSLEQTEYFKYENIVVQNSGYSPKVTGVVINPFENDITDLKINAIVYDEDDEIIGAGYTYLDFILSQSKGAVDPTVTLEGIPSNAEIYALITSLTEFE